MKEMDIRAYLYGLIVFLTLSFLLLLAYGVGGSLVEGLFTTFLGSAFTMLIVENSVRFAEKRRTAPARLAAYDDACLLCVKCRQMWLWMLIDTVNSIPPLGTNLFDIVYCAEICKHLDLDKPARVTPKRSWRIFITEFSDNVRSDAGKFISRYLSISDMETIRIMRLIERSNFMHFCGSLTAIHQSAKEKNFLRQPVLGDGLQQLARDFLSVIEELREHLEEIGKEFSHSDNFLAAPSASFDDFLNIQSVPPRMGFARYNG